MELPRLLHPRRVARCHLRRRREEGRLLSHAVQPLGAQGNLCARATSPGVAGELWEEEEEVVRSPPVLLAANPELAKSYTWEVRGGEEELRRLV